MTTKDEKFPFDETTALEEELQILEKENMELKKENCILKERFAKLPNTDECKMRERIGSLLHRIEELKSFIVEMRLIFDNFDVD